MAVLFLSGIAILYLLILLIIAALQILLKKEAKEADVSNLNLGCMTLFTPVYIVVFFYALDWFQTGTWPGVDLRATIQYFGLADPFLRQTSLLGFEKINSALLTVDIAWYLLLFSFLGTWMLCFSDWFEENFAPAIKRLRGRLRKS